MREPTPRTSRLAITAGIVVAFALVGAGFIAGRESAPAAQMPISKATSSAPMVTAPAPVVAESLGRADLLALAASAADASSSNSPIPAAVSAAAGRRFDLILPFGCEAPGSVISTGSMRWSFDPIAGKLKITIDPVTWQASDGDAADDGTKEALRGFWIARSWSSAMTCERAQNTSENTAAQPLVPPIPTIGIARPAANDGEKIRAFELVQRAGGEDFDPQKGFQLRISGRLRAGSEGGPVKCLQSGGVEQPPVCLIIGAFTEVRIENPKDKSVLASWPISDDLRARDSIKAQDPPKPPS